MFNPNMSTDLTELEFESQIRSWLLCILCIFVCVVVSLVYPPAPFSDFIHHVFIFSTLLIIPSFEKTDTLLKCTRTNQMWKNEANLTFIRVNVWQRESHSSWTNQMEHTCAFFMGHSLQELVGGVKLSGRFSSPGLNRWPIFLSFQPVWFCCILFVFTLISLLVM